MQSRFDSTWSSTLALLGREIDQLGGRDVVIECDVREQDIRIDGMIRANAKPETPAVERLLTSPKLLRQVLREAKAMTHPDRRGDREMWDQVEQAAIVLGVAS